jgi:hypothetical protein
MSFYSQGKVRNELLEPSVDSSFNRTEFRLPEGVLLNNLKVLSLGVFGGSGGYPKLVGALGVIKNIYLYDGKTELQSVKDFNDHFSFSVLQNSNSRNADIGTASERIRVGYKTQTSPTAASGPAGYLVRRTSFSQNQNVDFAASDSASGNNKAYLDLRDVFSILSVMPVLPSGTVFKQLRVVIEYDTDPKKYSESTATPASSGTLRPLMSVDSIVDDATAKALVSSLQSSQFTVYERDRYQVGVAANGAKSSSSVRLIGFNGKHIEKLRIKKNYQSSANFADPLTPANVLGFGEYASLSGKKEKFQVRVNGRALLPRDGIDHGCNRGLALMNDSYGELNLFENAVLPLSRIASDDYESYGTVTAHNVGTQDYFGIKIGQSVSDVQIDYSREGLTDDSTKHPSRYNSAMTHTVEAEILKQIMFNSDGSYNVMYV